MAHDVFISYPSENKLLADAICAKLESNAILCWIAPRDILPGQNYAEALLKAIDSSKIFILVFSKNTNSSPHIMSEVQRAFNHNRIIIPFRIENIEPSTALEYYIANAHWLDAITPPIEAQIDKLVNVVKINLDPQWEGNTDISPPKNVIPDPVQKPVLKKFVYPIIILFLLVVCLGLFLFSGLFHEGNGINISTQPLVPNQSPTAITQSSYMPTNISNTSWRTYKNVDSGFSIQYPSNLTLVDINIKGWNVDWGKTWSIRSSKDNSFRVDIDVHKPAETLEENVEHYIKTNVEDWPKISNRTLSEKKNLTLSGYPATKVVITSDENANNEIKTGKYIIMTTYLISTPNHFYYITGFHNSTTTMKYQSIIDAIVNSFKILQ